MCKTILTLIFMFTQLITIGQDYFQQKVDYNINVTLDDKKHLLIGEETIIYTNNSPNSLDVIWMHLWPNAYKNNKTALSKQKIEDGDLQMFYAKEEERGEIYELDFKVNGGGIEWRYHEEHIDICKLILNKPINPGESIIIQTPFKVKIPNAEFSRLGHIDQSYMITQWYPKPAVYDKNGWNIMPYVDQGEYYSEFGSFDVNITIPENYIVGATGDLQNKSEIERLDVLSNKTKKIEKFKNDMSFPESSSTTKTLKYKQENIHDFAWFADKRYHVLKGEVILPYSKDTVEIYTMFTNNEADLWKRSIEYMHDALYYYSLWNGDYPYKYCIAVDGTISAGGGMEYPNVTVIGESFNNKALEEVIMHEVGHNWFYGVLGSNERNHPWMDEGINSFNELRYMKKKYPNYNMLLERIPNNIQKILDLQDYTNKQIVGELAYMTSAWVGKDQPIELHSEQYTSINYGGIVYMKTAIVFDYLMHYLGEDIFDKCMKEYYRTWKFKHPGPEDLQEIFSKNTKEDLSWFFKDLIQTNKKLDYSISSVKKNNDRLLITIKNVEEIPAPVMISGVKDGKSYNEMWIEGFHGKKTIEFIDNEYEEIRIDYHGFMPEINRKNNIYNLKKLFKKIEPIRLQIIGSLYHPEKTQIFYHPNISFNEYNKLSCGISIYNKFIPKAGLSYKLSPMYSFQKNSIVGRGNISLTNYSHSSIFSKMKFSINGETFNYGQHPGFTGDLRYHRVSPELEIIINENNLRSKKEKKLIASYIYLVRDHVSFCCESEKMYDHYGNLEYYFSNKRTINPYSSYLQIETSAQHKKMNFVVNYYTRINKKKHINIRSYLGYVNTNNSKYDLQMSAWNGSMDYSFSERSFSREGEGNLSNQMFIREGGLKHYTRYRSSNLLSSISLDYNLMKNLNIYVEGGTNITQNSFGSGIFLKLSGIRLYMPVYTENGFFNGNKYYTEIRLNIQSPIKFNLSMF